MTKQVSIRLPLELVERIKVIAKRDNRSFSNQVVSSLHEQIKTIEDRYRENQE